MQSRLQPCAIQAATNPACHQGATLGTSPTTQVTRLEFHKAMADLQFNVPPAEIDALFSEWDPDGSGSLDLKELGRRSPTAASTTTDTNTNTRANTNTTADNTHANEC